MEEQLQHYQEKLAYEIDAWDLKVVLDVKENVIVVDARSPQSNETEPHDPIFDKKIEIARRGIRKYRDVLIELTK